MTPKEIYIEYIDGCKSVRQMAHSLQMSESDLVEKINIGKIIYDNINGML